ncbi:DNA ligase [Paenibacillus sp. HWE-109]|nr:DNA ligase [Paenibacillus sp. HWE-109]UKS31188.1 DNA ligase [Paenibacillus sp. HWE-109]
MLFTAIKPNLAQNGEEPFDDENYFFEPKWDGGRILLHKQGSRMEAYTRAGYKVTDKFPELKELALSLKAHTAILDCEGIVLRSGRPVFDDFTYRGRIQLAAAIKLARQSHPVTFVAFDVLLTKSEHMNEPLAERKKRLTDIIEPSPLLMTTIYTVGEGKALYTLMEERNMEGILAKRKDSKYLLNTVNKDWLKIKHIKSMDVLILGYRTKPFSLVIGLNFRTVKNKPVGLVSEGIIEADKQLFLALSQDLLSHQDEKTQWLRPSICCRIDYRDRTDAHQLRETVFRGFLSEKRPEDCVWKS